MQQPKSQIEIGRRERIGPRLGPRLESDLRSAPKPLLGLCRTSNSVLAGKIGRRERIRTSGPYVPNVVLYQAELLSEPVRRDMPLASGGALIAMPPRPRNRPEGPCEHIVRPGFSRFAGAGAYRYTRPPAPVSGLLGRRQVVRHWILIPAFEGSIPSAPAKPEHCAGRNFYQ